MKNLILFCSIQLLTLNLFANPILIADSQSKFNDYKTTCLEKNYSCLPLAYISLKQFNNQEVNELIEDFNLDNPTYIEKYMRLIPLIIKTQNVTQLQLEQILIISEKINAHLEETNELSSKQKNKPNQNFIEFTSWVQQLHLFYSEIDKLQKHDSQEFSESLIIALDQPFKLTPFNLEILKKHKNLIFINIVSYNTIQNLKTNVTDNLLSGDCESVQFHDLFKVEVKQKDILVPYFKNKCHFSEKLTSTTSAITQHLKENKNIYLTVGAVLLTSFLLKNYEIEITK